MPHIEVSMYPGRDTQKKQKLAQGLAKFVAEELAIDEKAVTVSIRDVPKENWNSEMQKISKDTMFVTK